MAKLINNLYGSEFICDRHVRVLGFIPTPWICGGIMKPVPPELIKLRCESCGHGKFFDRTVRRRLMEMSLLLFGLLVSMPVMAQVTK